MGLVAASELFLRMVWLARLSAARRRSPRPISMGLGRAARAGLHVLAPGARLRNSAAGGAHAGAPARRIPRLPGAHQCVLSSAAANLLRERSNALGANMSFVQTMTGFSAEHDQHGHIGNDIGHRSVS